MRAMTLLTMLMCCLPGVLRAAEPLWLETEHDFGTFLEDDGRQSCTMRVVNRGDEPMVFGEVRSSCGCTATDYPRNAIAPGDTAAITLTYSPTRRPGQFEKSVFVTLSGATAKQRLVIRGRVVGNDETVTRQFPIEAGPLRLDSESVPMGFVKRSGNKMGFVTGYNASVDTLVVSLSATAAQLDPMAIPDTVPPGGVTGISITLDAAKAPLWGFNCDTVGLTARPLHGVEPTGTATINVMAQVTEDFGGLTARQRERAPQVAVSCDERVSLGQVSATQGPVSRSFTVTNRGRDRLLVRRLWMPEGEGFSAAIDNDSIKRGQHATVTVTFDPSQAAAPLASTQLFLMTNDPDRSLTTIDVVAQVEQNTVQR